MQNVVIEDSPATRAYFLQKAKPLRVSYAIGAVNEICSKLKDIEVVGEVDFLWGDPIKSCEKATWLSEKNEAMMPVFDNILTYGANYMHADGGFNHIHVVDGVLVCEISDYTGRKALVTKDTPFPNFSRDEVYSEFVTAIERYANLYARQAYPTYCSNPDTLEEMLQEARTEYIANVYKYNGQQALTTFSKPHLLHGFQKAISFLSNRTTYENEVANIVSRERNRLLASNYSEEDANNLSILQEKLGDKLSMTQIKKGLEILERTNTEEFNPDVQISATFETPEDTYFKNEQRAMINIILESLPEHERFLIEAITGELTGYKIKYSDVGESQYFIDILKRANLTDKFKYDENGRPFVTKDTVSQMFRQAQAHARNCPFARPEMVNLRERVSRDIGDLEVDAYYDVEENQSILFK